MTINPRVTNGHRRRQLRARILRTEHDCGICGEEVDKTIPNPDPLSPEIDEIIPVALGGNPLDPTNCRLAHRICNACRGTGRHAGYCIACQHNGSPIVEDDYADDSYSHSSTDGFGRSGLDNLPPGTSYITWRTW